MVKISIMFPLAVTYSIFVVRRSVDRSFVYLRNTSLLCNLSCPCPISLPVLCECYRMLFSAAQSMSVCLCLLFLLTLRCQLRLHAVQWPSLFFLNTQEFDIASPPLTWVMVYSEGELPHCLVIIKTPNINKSIGHFLCHYLYQCLPCVRTCFRRVLAKSISLQEIEIKSNPSTTLNSSLTKTIFQVFLQYWIVQFYILH